MVQKILGEVEGPVLNGVEGSAQTGTQQEFNRRILNKAEGKTLKSSYTININNVTSPRIFNHLNYTAQ